MTIDLSRLQPPEAIERLEVEQIFQDMKADLVQASPDLEETLQLESEPLTKMLMICAYREFVNRQHHNGQIQSILLAYASDSNLDHLGITRFGEERLQNESDDAYRNRLLIAPDKHSTAGASAGYRFHALSSDSRIKDITAENNGPGQVYIAVLGKEGSGSASSELISIVTSALNSEAVRPLTDSVVVQSAQILSYQVQAALTIEKGPDTTLISQRAQQAVEDYVQDQHRLGAEIIRDKIQSLLYIEGVRHVSMTHPAADVVCTQRQAPYCTSVSLSHD